MTDQSTGRLPIEQIIYSDEELEWIADRWNSSFSISSLDSKARQSFLSSLRRGFLQLEGIIQSAYEWSALAGQLNQISAKKIWLNAKAAPKTSGDERLVRLLADQPSTSLGEREQKQCLAVGALAGQLPDGVDHAAPVSPCHGAARALAAKGFGGSR